MGDQRVYNFAAGPSMLPLPALERAGREITNFQGSGMSVMEMSHRSKVFLDIFQSTRDKLRRLMKVPEGYQILFLQTGASGQFSMVPLNLIGKTGRADYAVTGNFSALACKEARKYGDIHVAADSGDRDHRYIPAQEDLDQAPLPGTGLRHGSPQKCPAVRGPQPRDACLGLRPLFPGDRGVPAAGGGDVRRNIALPWMGAARVR